MFHISFVCLGNICRSPTAEGVMRHKLASLGALDHVQLDSAGTGAWHVGEPPDRRSTAVAAQRGITLDGAARRFRAKDFGRFDLVLAMDQSNLRDLRAMAPTEAHQGKLFLFRRFDPSAGPQAEVPDPYYGGPRGFEDVLDICDRAADGLLEHLRTVGAL